MNAVTFDERPNETLRLTDGVKTGALWGPGVEGHRYAYRSEFGRSVVLRLADRESADAFLRAELASGRSTGRRGKCCVCGNDVAISMSGLIRAHLKPPRPGVQYRLPCEGSRRLPAIEPAVGGEPQ